jgi:hypothetical protein
MCQSRKFQAAAREGFSMMSTGSMRREPHCCWKLLLRLTCRIVAATALLLAANQIRATALPAVPASQSAPSAASALDIAGTWQGTLHFLKTDQHRMVRRNRLGGKDQAVDYELPVSKRMGDFDQKSRRP